MDLPDPSFPSRRRVLGGGVALLALAGLPPVALALPAPGADRERPGFLTAPERATLRGVVDRIVPDDDGTPGALATGCAEAIDALLAAFDTDPPRIYAGGPFSDRGGARRNDFARFLPLDRYETRAWRRRIEGPGGFRTVYRRGLRALAAETPGFASLPGVARDLALRSTQDTAARRLIDLAVTHTLELHFGAPEYGGNRGTAGWRGIGFDGDRQPRGYTRREVERPRTRPLPLLAPLFTVPLAPTALGAAAAMTWGGSDDALGRLAAGADHGALRDVVRERLGALEALEALDGPDGIRARAEAIVARVQRERGGS